MVWRIIPCSPNMVTVRVCSKLKTSWKSVVFINKVRNNSRYFVGVFNKTIIPLALAWICDDYSQLRATLLVGHPPSHIQRTLEEQLLKRRTLFFRWVIVQFNTDITLSLKSLARSESTLLIIIFCFSKEIVLCVVDFFRFWSRERN